MRARVLPTAFTEHRLYTALARATTTPCDGGDESYEVLENPADRVLVLDDATEPVAVALAEHEGRALLGETAPASAAPRVPAPRPRLVAPPTQSMVHPPQAAAAAAAAAAATPSRGVRTLDAQGESEEVVGPMLCPRLAVAPASSMAQLSGLTPRSACAVLCANVVAESRALAQGPADDVVLLEQCCIQQQLEFAKRAAMEHLNFRAAKMVNDELHRVTALLHGLAFCA